MMVSQRKMMFPHYFFGPMFSALLLLSFARVAHAEPPPACPGVLPESTLQDAIDATGATNDPAGSSQFLTKKFKLNFNFEKNYNVGSSQVPFLTFIIFLAGDAK